MVHKLALVFLISIIITLTSTEAVNFDYKNHGDDWSKYSVSSDWSGCDIDNQANNQQSPIQLQDSMPSSNNSFLFYNLVSSKFTVQYLNTTVYAKGNGFGQIYTRTVAGDVVPLKGTQIRFRSHSQHKINGKFYDLQMQIFFLYIYASDRNERLGLSIMFEVDDKSSNTILKTIKNSYVTQNNATTITLDLSTVLNNSQNNGFWYYKGSYTIPPCKNSNVQWIVSKKVYKMSQQQRDFFYNRYNNKNMDGNYRNVQPLRNNIVKKYEFSSI